MKPYLFFLALGWVVACTSPEQASITEDFQPITPVDSIVQDMNSVEEYLGTVLLPDLDEGNYTVYDSSGMEMSQGTFLASLQSGNSLPLKMEAEQDTLSVYQMESSVTFPTEQASQLIQFIGRQYALFHQLEGNPLPNFHFTDLNGKTYQSEALKDKLVVLKFWFIGCKPCIAEMPTLNQLVEQYQNRDDVVFISLANDGAEELLQFLEETRFDYAVVPEKTSYTMDTLGISAFPTHMIIENGIIAEVTNRAANIVELLNERMGEI